MIKNFITALFLCVFLIACGKKGDPKYKESKKKFEIQSVSINKSS